MQETSYKEGVWACDCDGADLTDGAEVRDVRFGVPPLTPQEAREMIRGIQGFPLLEGVRGEAGADLELLEEILLRLTQLAERHPTIQELDINPFVAAGAESAKALDVRIRVSPVDA